MLSDKARPLHFTKRLGSAERQIPAFDLFCRQKDSVNVSDVHLSMAHIL